MGAYIFKMENDSIPPGVRFEPAIRRNLNVTYPMLHRIDLLPLPSKVFEIN